MDYLRRSQEAFDVVFLDPPFRQNALASALGELPGRLPKGGRVYVEAPAPLEAQAPWRELRRARAGQVSYQLLEKQ
jgi:16S rRNA (guanine966-N2)-methyltransferase